MWHLLAAILLSTPSTRSEEITLRVENWASCTVRVQVLQRGVPRRTIFVESNSTVVERFRVPSTVDPIGFRVIGIGCTFPGYNVEPLNTRETSLMLRLHNMPSLSYSQPYPRTR